MTHADRNGHLPEHKLTSISTNVHYHVPTMTISLGRVYGHSDSTLGVVWTHRPDTVLSLKDDPYAIHTALLDLQTIVEVVARDRPNTQARLDFSLNGGLHGTDPMF